MSVAASSSPSTRPDPLPLSHRPPLPADVIIVSAISIVLGTLACVEVACDLQRHHLTFNFDVLMVPLGVGVLLRSNGCRVLLAVFLLLSLVLLPIALCMALIAALTGEGTIRLVWFGAWVRRPAPLHIVMAMAACGAVFWLVHLWMFMVLRFERTRAAFGLKPRVRL